MAPTLDAIPPVRTGRRGRPRRRPDKLHADKAYDAKARRQECWARGIVPRIARKGIESSEKLGRHRWVVDPSAADLTGWLWTGLIERISQDRRSRTCGEVRKRVR
ncbi:hypothetical protein HNR00_001860, partial [Methylorubrum rhodinum]|nr:hypothetical protein [Methylorubrum rhodinum]